MNQFEKLEEAKKAMKKAESEIKGIEDLSISIPKLKESFACDKFVKRGNYEWDYTSIKKFMGEEMYCKFLQSVDKFLDRELKELQEKANEKRAFIHNVKMQFN